jgi:hypothetical protein
MQAGIVVSNLLHGNAGLRIARGDPRRNELITSDSSAYVRVTCLPSTLLSKPSFDASRTRGRSSSTEPLVVFTVRGS